MRKEGRPIEGGHCRAIELDLFHQRAADRLDSASVDLVLQPVRVDDLTAVMGNEEFRDPDRAGRHRKLDFGDRGDVGAHQLVFAIGHAAANQHVAALLGFRREPRIPFRERGGPLQHLDAASVIEMLEPKLDRIGLGQCGQFINEAFISKGILHPAR
jgi:hypothetical protein